MKPDDEQIWLRHKVIRMRTLLRYAKEPCFEIGLREFSTRTSGDLRTGDWSPLQSAERAWSRTSNIWKNG